MGCEISVVEGPLSLDDPYYNIMYVALFWCNYRYMHVIVIDQLLRFVRRSSNPEIKA